MKKQRGIRFAPDGTPERPTPETVARWKAKAERKAGAFLRGPVPLPWLCRAARLPGKALAFGLVLWFCRGFGESKIRISPALLERFGVERRAGYRALSALESAGLVSVQRHRGRAAVVTIRKGK